MKDSSGSSDSESSDGGNVGIGVTPCMATSARQQTAELVWRMALRTVLLYITFTGNPGIQVLTAGFRPQCFSLLINDDLLKKVKVKFKDIKGVYITTIHDDSMVTKPDRRHGSQHHTKPTSIADYNKYIGGVDRTDQLLKPCEAPRKTLQWYKKVAIHFMQLSMLHSIIVYEKDGGQKLFLGSTNLRL